MSRLSKRDSKKYNYIHTSIHLQNCDAQVKFVFEQQSNAKARKMKQKFNADTQCIITIPLLKNASPLSPSPTLPSAPPLSPTPTLPSDQPPLRPVPEKPTMPRNRRENSVRIPSIPVAEPVLLERKPPEQKHYEITFWFQFVAIVIQLCSILIISICVWAVNQNFDDVLFPLYTTDWVFSEDLVKLDSTPITTFMDREFTLSIRKIDFNVSVAGGIIAFLLGSFLFEGGALLCMYQVLFKNPFTIENRNKQNILIYTLRFVEYSITAPIMLIVIAVQAGIWDIRTLAVIFLSTSTCMMCGYIVEDYDTKITKYSNRQTENTMSVAKNKSFQWKVHAIGWLALIAAWLPIVLAYGLDKKLPSNVRENLIILMIGEIIFWVLFAVVQMIQITDWIDSQQASRAYVFLSLTSKNFLAWGIVFMVFAN